jgi:uncharacterized protein (UPF0212 family)
MTITQAIKSLEDLREVVGDVQVCADCPRCGNAFEVGIVSTGPPVVRLREEKQKR